MEDLIKREDAIDAIECITWYHQNRNKDMVSGANSDEHQAWYKSQDIYEALESIPSADRLQEWIPCSERLPETDGDYLVTFHHKWPDREYKTVEVAEFRNGGFDENLYVKVIAWMPLLKPWKGANNV